MEESTSEDITDISDSNVCTKYREAAKIVNIALEGLMSQVNDRVCEEYFLEHNCFVLFFCRYRMVK